MRGEWEISFWVIILSQKWSGFSFDYHGGFADSDRLEALREKGLQVSGYVGIGRELFSFSVLFSGEKVGGERGGACCQMLTSERKV